MNTIDKLTEYFTKFPGIGSRQAKRLVYFILGQGGDFSGELSNLLARVREDITQCDACFRFYHSPATDERTECSICTDTQREDDVLMVIEKDADLEVMRRTDSYRGKFFILGGSLPLLEKQPNSKIRARGLHERVHKDLERGALKEIILALSAHPEGDHTASYIKQILSPYVEKHGLIITVLGRGLSTGTELEYSDLDTLHHALKNRGV